MTTAPRLTAFGLLVQPKLSPWYPAADKNQLKAQEKLRIANDRVSSNKNFGASSILSMAE
jgi:hypothetical protein